LTGKLYNRPTPDKTPGNDVYEGCNIAYKADNLTVENLLAVLKGNASAVDGPVLKSDQNSQIFFYLAGHGDAGTVGFPTQPFKPADENLYAD
jgi:legumain